MALGALHLNPIVFAWLKNNTVSKHALKTAINTSNISKLYRLFVKGQVFKEKTFQKFEKICVKF